jgi:cytochrome c oxidase subunit 2
MTAEPHAPAPADGQAGPSHGRRIFIIWLVLSVVAEWLLWFVLGPHMPPGNMASAADGQQFDIRVMSVMAAPVMLLVLVFIGYALVVWRSKEGDDGDGPPLHGHRGVQTTWIAVSSVIVLCLAGFGTYELTQPGGAGAGEGPAPIWNPPGAVFTAAQQQAPWTPGKPLVVQVIGQQWRFTYRYPQFNGFETTNLFLPQGQWIQFNVTSIDVIHSFWAYQLGVKADANPGVDNVAYTKTTHLGQVTVRCAELCGLWHGAMFDFGRVVPVAQFQAWAAGTEQFMAKVTPLLPPYATTYEPAVIPLFKLSPVMKSLGVLGAGGGYYPPADPVQP